ncbi:MAG TPA: CDP-alcohol phosphatidyltransferase family protein [Halanaerobiaceae bacterium]|jgi:CDP-diacylglycerol--glycerol-3-phosphate 3-phosphatidyltransferase|nr:CDP-alcohol phosphatidyltransferase family protein [Bacillota bacterium]HHU93012.1 CDP-alcohol phosphatidyltransferase family protein [Halanaerobiaceae bacterium]HOA40974.1 CDP-alcohol phosphatidyltransferase family protein [Halanaerobiales bacterium]HPZ63137.1 CDP-alcohol phosphatidyltransferase family protein [Halanaerobiales bacterium]HQD04401.1 CDP-alcohol phosphatidyltransferase family protein [Halanaerobiales bacterium]
MSAIPNLLSITRIILIPIYLYFFMNANYLTAGILFSISAITDFFDGYIARKYDSVTKLGRILDPFADKLTIISILIALIISKIIPVFIPIILLARELLIFLGSIVAYLLGFDFIHPSKLGKFSIFLLYLAIALQLIGIKILARGLFYIVIPLNIFSGLNYVYTTIKYLSNKKNK